MFKIIKKSKKFRARLGVLKTANGKVRTPFFMPVATQGAVKHITADEMRKLGAQILLANTYHLMLKPGEKLIKKGGGLHKFINWQKPILTDSGGFQVFSLASGRNRSGESLVKLSKNGVKFKSYIDGREFYLTPEKAFKIQLDLGVDIAVCLDECVSLPAPKDYIKKSIELTTYWAKKTKIYYNKIKVKKPLLFCVIQGGLDKELRLKSLKDLIKVGFSAQSGTDSGWDGYNIGGLSVGETSQEMYKVLDYLVPEIPADKPRYLMGVGYPENIIEAVKRGVDMFDCVIPTREGRHGRLFLHCHSDPPERRGRIPRISKSSVTAGRTEQRNKIQPRDPSFRYCSVQDDKFYKKVNINKAEFRDDFLAINKNSKLPELREYSKAYLHYLFKIKEPLGMRLASLNNLEFYLDLMRRIRRSIGNGEL
ncbi:tRNA guanosine(34) transglycosylase Tgt [Candidatus Falkowbacteria bacterium]|nr:MAG: tRNA guanosine(34) transglycosylase Tgt [Candidatus Falkowbacteria bacterium]